MKLNVNEIGIRHIEERIQLRKATFLSPLSPVFKETVKSAAILNELISSDEDHKSFFCNSHMEGVHGAIKLARHYNYMKKKSSSVVILDDEGYYRDYFSPTEEIVMVPGILFAKNLKELVQLSKEHEIGIFVISLKSIKEDDATVNWALKQSNAVKILDYSRVDSTEFIAEIEAVRKGWDIVVWGEALTQNQIPVGGFSARSTIYKPWDNSDNCLLHSSTYAGNGMVTSLIVKTLGLYFPDLLEKNELKSIFDTIESSINGKNKFTKRFINSSVLKVHESMNLNFEVTDAQGNTLKLEHKYGKTVEVFDCVGGGGCNVLGHNPNRLFEKVKKKYSSSETGHIEQLRGKLHGISGLEHLFMGVSGASVVEIGMTLARIANPKRKKIVAFTGNYAGKTLIAMSGTYTGIKSYFQPLYDEIILVDPFSNGATAYLKEVFEEGEVGLVWFEHIQGGQLLNIAPTLLSFLSKNKEKYGYYLGVDEILQGVYRTGKFFSFDNELLKPDIITVSKGLSGMLYPIASAMVSSRVVDEANKNSPDSVKRLANLYTNEFAACIAEQLLIECENLEVPKHIRSYSENIRKRSSKLVGRDKIFSRVEMRGFHIRFDLNTKIFPFKNFDLPDRNKVLTKLFLEHNILSFQGRLLLPLNVEDHEIEKFIENLEKIAKTSRLKYSQMLYGNKYKRTLLNRLKKK